MPYARRRRWIEAATGTDTIRKAAAAVGVSHPTLSRWIKSGIPVGTLSELVVRFECDPIEAMVVWGYLEHDDVPRLNYEAMARYIPKQVLAAELHRRMVEFPDDPIRKTSVGMLRRA